MPLTKTTATVQLNVGGTKYTVSKALIEQYPTTMLARLVSDTWQKDPAEEIFIDRDGHTFRHVLAYMRDLKVSLSLKQASKETVQLELAYFGFENVPDDAIQNCFSPSGVVEYCSTQKRSLRDHHITKLKAVRGEVAKLRTRECLEIVAYHCFDQYCSQGNLTSINVTNISDTNACLAIDYTSNVPLLNEYLRVYGLRCARCVRVQVFSPYTTVDLETL